MTEWKQLTSVVTETPDSGLTEFVEKMRVETEKRMRYFLGDLPPDEMAEMKAKLEREAEERSKYCPECGREW